MIAAISTNLDGWMYQLQIAGALLAPWLVVRARRLARAWGGGCAPPDPMDRLDGVVDEVALIPSARFFRLSHAPKRAVVVGPRIALIHLVRRPPAAARGGRDRGRGKRPS